MREMCFENMNVKVHGGTNLIFQIMKQILLKWEPAWESMNIWVNQRRSLCLELWVLMICWIPNFWIFKKWQKNPENRKFINVIRFNDFKAGFTSGASIKVLKEDAADKLDTNFELQIIILIESEEDLETKAMLREYYERFRDKEGFSEEGFIEEILQKTLKFLWEV